MNSYHIEDKDFLKLPLKIRQQWWRETYYGKQDPSPELLEKIEKILQKPLGRKDGTDQS